MIWFGGFYMFYHWPGGQSILETMPSKRGCQSSEKVISSTKLTFSMCYHELKKCLDGGPSLRENADAFQRRNTPEAYSGNRRKPQETWDFEYRVSYLGVAVGRCQVDRCQVARIRLFLEGEHSISLANFGADVLSRLVKTKSQALISL